MNNKEEKIRIAFTKTLTKPYVQQLEAMAKRKNLSLSSFIFMLVAERMEQIKIKKLKLINNKKRKKNDQNTTQNE